MNFMHLATTLCNWYDNDTFIAVVTSYCAGGKEPTTGILSPMKPSKIQMIIDIIHCDSVINNGAFSYGEEKQTCKHKIFI